MNPGIKKILLIVAVVLLLSTAVNYFTGTTISVNGKQITGAGRYIAAYFGLVVLGALLVVVIPSVFVLAAVLSIFFIIFAVLFFPVLPLALLLLPGIVFAGIVYLIYRVVRKNKH